MDIKHSYRLATEKLDNAASGALARVKDPLTIMVTFNYVGDSFIVASGGDYGNPVRMGSAIVGAAAGTAGLLSKDDKFLGFDARNFVMNGIRLGAVGFIISGSNICGFEEAPRYSEMAAGFLLASGATLNIHDRPKLGSAFFLSTSALWGAQVLETWAGSGNPDLYMLGAFLAFMVSNGSTFFMKRKNADTPEQILGDDQGFEHNPD